MSGFCTVTAFTVKAIKQAVMDNQKLRHVNLIHMLQMERLGWQENARSVKECHDNYLTRALQWTTNLICLAHYNKIPFMACLLKIWLSRGLFLCNFLVTLIKVWPGIWVNHFSAPVRQLFHLVCPIFFVKLTWISVEKFNLSKIFEWKFWYEEKLDVS